MFIFFLIISILVPPIGFVSGFVGLAMDRKHWKWYVFCLALAMSSIAYCYHPKGDPDIIRYLEFVKQLEPYSLSEAMKQGIHGETNMYTFTFICWLISKLAAPQVLPALSVFCVYYVGFYITCQLGEDTNAKMRTIILYLIFIIFSLNLYAIINNVRNVCAFALISLAIFREMYQKKRNVLTLVLYILPLFLHTSAVLLIFIRFIVKYSRKFKLLLFILVSNIMLILDFVFAVVKRIESGNIVVSLVRNLIIKAHFYFNNTTSDWGNVVSNSLSYKLERILNVSFAFMLCYLIYYIAHKKITTDREKILAILPWRKDNGEVNCFILWNQYCFLLALSTIACLPMIMPEYWRFYSITVVCSALPFLTLVGQRKQNVRLRAFMIFSVTPFCMLLTLKFIIYSDLKALIIGPFMSSPIIVVGEILVHLII